MSPRPDRRIPTPAGRWPAAAGALAGLIALAASWCVPAPLALINESASLPKGLYLRAPRGDLRVGSVVAVPQPAEARPYLAALGLPRRIRLLKRVAALGGAPVCASADVLRWPHGAARALRRDRQGMRLHPWQGCRRLAAGELLLIGDTAASFDSRYFGPVARTAADGPYVEILTW